MPQIGRRPAPVKKPPPKPKPAPVPQYGSESSYTGSSQQQKAGNNKTSKTIAASTATSIINSKRAAVQKAGTGGITKRQEVNVQSDSKRLASAIKTGASKTASQKRNADRFGFKAPTGDAQRRKFGGTSTGTGGGGGSTSGDRGTGGGNLGKPISEGGQGDGGKLRGAFNDPNLVGSTNDITEFDGSQFSGGGFEDVAAGGGGSGSSLAGRESVGQVGQLEGQSLDEVVYGVKKKGRKVARARGE